MLTTDIGALYSPPALFSFIAVSKISNALFYMRHSSMTCAKKLLLSKIKFEGKKQNLTQK